MSDCYMSKENSVNHCNSSELSVETSSSEVADHFNIFTDNLSPIPAVVPRKLDFSSFDNDDGMRDASPAPVSLSPPYKRVRALRLFDSPHTPKTLLEKCSTPTHHPLRVRLFPPKLTISTAVANGSGKQYLPTCDDSALSSLNESQSRSSLSLIANTNPFTPDALNAKKRALSKTPVLGEVTPEQPAKRLRESNISRYNVEFVDLGVIGIGQFGRVAKCVNKLDGCIYAIKRSLRPVAGSVAERAAITEVYAHAALGKHPHVVRYYSAWAEDDHMIIQNEYCDGGSLQQRLENGPLPENELRLLLKHIADGLAYIHSLQLAHMDVKPGNIFLCYRDGLAYDDDEADETPQIVYKLGDLGHVTCVTSPHVEEGDCRYLPKEVLQEDLTMLTMADIFAFGLTLFEAAGGGQLPKNGQRWHDLREGKLPTLPNLSREFNALLKKMVDPVPAQRPSALNLRRHPIVCGSGAKNKAQLRRELAEVKLKTQLLERQLQEAARCIKSLTPSFNQESTQHRTRSSKRTVQRLKTETEPVVTSPKRVVRSHRSKRDN